MCVCSLVSTPNLNRFATNHIDVHAHAHAHASEPEVIWSLEAGEELRLDLQHKLVIKV
jgi:hypothetical protein